MVEIRYGVQRRTSVETRSEPVTQQPDDDRTQILQRAVEAGRRQGCLDEGLPALLKRYYRQSGELLDISANAGSGRGLFVTEFDFN